MSVLSVSTPPFIEDENIFQNSVSVFVIQFNSAYNHGGRFLSCIFKITFFLSVEILCEIGRCR